MSRIETVEVGGTEYTLGVDKDSTVTFTEAQTRTNIASGESLATMFGKIKKFFTDLKTVAFTGNVADMSDVTITSPALGDSLFHDGTEWVNKNLMVEVTKAEYDALVANNEDDPNVDYHITDIDVAEAYYVETSGQTALTGATSLTFTNSHITPTSDIRILAEPASCKVSTNPQYKVSAKLSSVGSGTATITFPALAENTTFWLLIECPLAVTVDPAYVYNTDETVIGQWMGKPLYRKSYYASGTISDGTVLDSNITSSNCKIRSIKETYYRGTVYNGRTDATPIGASTRTYFMCSIGDSSVFLQLSTTISEYNVTIEYTKNTD